MCVLVCVRVCVLYNRGEHKSSCSHLLGTTVVYVRTPHAIVDPNGGGQALVEGRHVEHDGIDVQDVQQVACGADHSGGEG